MEFKIQRKSDDELKHYGIPGQVHGIRNYQYEDGSYTPAGKERYGKMRKEKHATKINPIKQNPDNKTEVELREEEQRKSQESREKKINKLNELGIDYHDFDENNATITYDYIDDHGNKRYEVHAMNAFLSNPEIDVDRIQEVHGILTSEGDLYSSGKDRPQLNRGTLQKSETKDMTREVEPSRKSVSDLPDEAKKKLKQLEKKIENGAPIRSRSAPIGTATHADTNDELMHYGILGMKWGVRRYQKENGKLTPEGRERYRQDVQQFKADKNKAYTISKNATIAGYAAEVGQRRADKANAKLDKALESGNEKRIAKASKKADIAKQASDALWEEYNSLAKQGEEHVAELINRYGEEHVKGLKYRETAKGKVIDDDSSEIPAAAVAAGASAISVALAATGVTPIGVIMVPRSNKSRGIELANIATVEARKAYGNHERESARNQSPSGKPTKSNSNSNWSYTKEERAAAKTKANEKDVWNLEFLERVQNKTYATGTSKDPQKKKRMMQEYDAFLRDPVNYRPPDGDED